MHGDLAAARPHVVFDLAGKNPLTANLFQRAIDDLIASGFDHHD
jgi:hypothetical protein